MAASGVAYHAPMRVPRLQDASLYSICLAVLLVALALGTGFTMVRKKGKLPYETRSVSYDLEYGTDTVEMHIDAVKPGQRVLLVDDLIATGGTAAAAVRLARDAGAQVVACAFLIELGFLKGRSKLGVERVHVVLNY